MDENFARMKKSCERIAVVLGIKEGTDLKASSFLQRKSMPDSIHKSDVKEMKYTNMNNPSGVRGMTSREEDG
jgi:hypothetical protein